MNPKVAEGIRLFNSHRFFEAHEALEEVWLKAEGQQKAFLHGLIQVAAAFHHHARGNTAGFRSLLEKGMSKLEQVTENTEGIQLRALLTQLGRWRDHLRKGHPANLATPPPIPQIKETTTRRRLREGTARP